MPDGSRMIPATGGRMMTEAIPQAAGIGVDGNGDGIFEMIADLYETPHIGFREYIIIRIICRKQRSMEMDFQSFPVIIFRMVLI